MKNKPFVIAFLISCSTLIFAQQTVEVVQHNENKDGSVSQIAIHLGSPIIPIQYDMAKIAANDALVKNYNYTNEDLQQSSQKPKKTSVSYTIPNTNPVTNPYLAAYSLVFKDARQAFIDKNYAKSIDLCDYLLSINRDNSEAYFLKGAAHYGLGKKEIALKFLEIAAHKGSKEAQEVLQIHKK
jgi:tetratricopeptide (TPR) repeat protein